jgi:hypothetical protein
MEKRLRQNFECVSGVGNGGIKWIACESVEWLNMAQDRIQLRAVVTSLMNLRTRYCAPSFLTSSITIFVVKILLLGVIVWLRRWLVWTWVSVAQNRVTWRVLVLAVLNLRTVWRRNSLLDANSGPWWVIYEREREVFCLTTLPVGNIMWRKR